MEGDIGVKQREQAMVVLGSRTRSRRALPKLFLIALFFAFLFLKLSNLTPRVSDENWFFYAVHLVTEGSLPYRDFFFAHLPGQLLLYLPLMRGVGFNLTIIKSFSFLFVVASAFLLYRMLARRVNSTSGLFAAALFLFSPIVMWTSDFVSGVHESTFFLVLSWYLLSSSPVWAGLALSAGLLTRQYILPAAIGLVIWEVSRRKYRIALSYLLAAALPFLLVNIGLFLWFSEAFLTPAWRYHLLAKFTQKQTQGDAVTFLRDNWAILLFSLAGIWMLLRHRGGMARWRRGVKLGHAALVALFAQVLFLASLTYLFQLYYVTLVPFLAVLSSLALTIFLPSRSRKIAALAVMVLVIYQAVTYQRELARNGEFAELGEISSFVRSSTREEETLFGAYEVTPLLALSANRSITQNELDTNEQRHLAGLMSVAQATRLATQSGMFIQLGALDRSSSELLRIHPQFVDLDIVSEACNLSRSARLSGGMEYGVILLWRCP